MAKGATEKSLITTKILETFQGSFLWNEGKEIRIPINDVEIKVTLTCAKENIGGATVAVAENKTPEVQLEEPTEQEISEVNNFLDKLNL